jgi:hypothetical protein
MYQPICAEDSQQHINAQIVVLPHWLLNTLEAYGKPLTTALNIEELKDILLVDDIAKYMYLNQRLLQSDNRIMVAVRKSFNSYFMTSSYSGFLGGLQDKKLASQIEDKIRILPVQMDSQSNTMSKDCLGKLDSSIDPAFLREWKLWEVIQLFNGSASAEEIKEYKASRGFELIYIDEHHMGLKLVKGNPRIDPDMLLVKNLDNCMSVMNQYYDFSNVSQTALFDLFMQYTSKQTLGI